jgi:hypothetical protein
VLDGATDGVLVLGLVGTEEHLAQVTHNLKQNYRYFKCKSKSFGSGYRFLTYCRFGSSFSSPATKKAQFFHAQKLTIYRYNF